MSALEKLVKEYRPSMDAEVLHSWAAEVVAALSALPSQEAEAVAPTFSVTKALREAYEVLGKVSDAHDGDELAKSYCQCNSLTNPCIVCGKPKFVDPAWLRRKIEEDGDEGEIGAGFELFPAPTIAPVAVRVKALEWIERVGVTDTFDAKTSIGNYIAALTDDGQSFWFVVGLTRSNYTETLEAAKAAAQSDFDARIRSAIIPAKPAGVVEALAPEEKRGNFIAVTTDEPQINNWHTAIYEDNYKGILIAVCNQNGRYPWQVRAILAGLNAKNETVAALQGATDGVGL